MRAVLKVSPKIFYDFFERKDFEKECQTHRLVAMGTEHIVDIREMAEGVLQFGDESIDCFYAELEYIEGELLSDYIEGRQPITAQRVAQISIDLLRLQQEFRRKNVYHNDLHSANVIIQELGAGQHRANAIDGSIRAVAIDLGSVFEYSRSDSESARYGDLHWICAHLDRLIEQLLAVPDDSGDLEYRLASALQLIFHLTAAEVENQRTPRVEDLIEQISDAYWRLPRQPVATLDGTSTASWIWSVL